MSGQMCLETMGGVCLDYVVSDALGASVIWVRDAHVVARNGRETLSFCLAVPGVPVRRSSRITDRVTRQDSDFAHVQLFGTELRVAIGRRSIDLRIMLCESGILDAPAILTPDDLALFQTG